MIFTSPFWICWERDTLIRFFSYSVNVPGAAAVSLSVGHSTLTASRAAGPARPRWPLTMNRLWTFITLLYTLTTTTPLQKNTETHTSVWLTIMVIVFIFMMAIMVFMFKGTVDTNINILSSFSHFPNLYEHKNKYLKEHNFWSFPFSIMNVHLQNDKTNNIIIIKIGNMMQSLFLMSAGVTWRSVWGTDWDLFISW